MVGWLTEFKGSLNETILSTPAYYKNGEPLQDPGATACLCYKEIYVVARVESHETIWNGP